MKPIRYRMICLAFSFLGVSTLEAQVTTAPSKTSTQLEALRKSIPGETMGAKLESLLFWTQQEAEQRFPIMHQIFPSKKVPAGNHLYRLPQGKILTPKWEDHTTLNSYLEENNIAGVIVIKNGKIRLEAYGENVNQHTLWTSFSMAKSVTSMLIGAALKDGYIESLDDVLQKYIPELKGHDYGKVSIRQLISMKSGIDWNEDYTDPNSDVAQMYLLPCHATESHILTYMKPMKALPSGNHPWNYSTGETDLAGILVQKATGKSLAEYLSEKIWQPMGMQQDAYWLADECSGLNIGGSGLSASLRDYARLGMLMLNAGKMNQHEIFDQEWLSHATKNLQSLDNEGNGYGYLWWTFGDGSYAAVGIFGQMIYINPKEKLVIAQIAAWPQATSEELTQKRKAFIEAVQRAL